ncbi:MAG: hypothetical protein A7316_06015 [Candidatus Altiarchaeales archaeon WOR_SM1_86-2]|nr:MAG: hypothetical protein A7316_06015 [Candidatus Altiarchaeales archaeon WOR_SM1_86-2]ODS41754.1 MAG: hypothetical protein A7315_00335 [Candidatus Altiarchaeales archaeon WOR_SM1_79]
MPRQKFSNQTSQQIIAHLSNILDCEIKYNLIVDPLGIRFAITKSTKQKRTASSKRKKLKEEQKDMTKKQRKLSSTKKRTRPKIRSIKKGRTVTLKGRTQY